MTDYSDYKNRSRAIAREAYWDKHDRESYECPDCGRTEEQIRGKFEVHHISGEAMDNRPENHVALCRLCHNLREGKKPPIKQIEQLRTQFSKSEQSTEKAEKKGIAKARAHQENLFIGMHDLLKTCPSVESLPDDNEASVEMVEKYLNISNVIGYDINEVMTPKTRRELAVGLSWAEELKSYYESKTLSPALSRFKCEKCGRKRTKNGFGTHPRVFAPFEDAEPEGYMILCDPCAREINE